LGVVRGTDQLAGVSKRPRFPIEDITAGRFHTTSRGRCFIVESDYELGHLHGTLPLSAFLSASPDAAGWISGDPSLARVNLHKTCFLDTETTGLSAGTGTMAFVVGLGFFVEQKFCVRQYFLRDPGDEPAMIEALADQLPQFEALASFNGRAFDVPILENRFILARVSPPTAGVPHLDLLGPSRRLWRYSLSSCRLNTLEKEVLGVLREQDDVPGGVIPLLYRDYLRTGDARDMKRVLYHNAIDILSLVTLAARLCHSFAVPRSPTGLRGAELFGVGRWYAAKGHISEAEQAYRTAIRGELTPALRSRSMRSLAEILKRSGRRGDAFAYWQQVALETEGDAGGRVVAHVELAKHFEWVQKDLPLAAGWTRAAIALAEGWEAGTKRGVALGELHHRLDRLERKLGRTRARRPDTPE
jgi:uncharacterized protein YprB with RNaseH-like and TPR domain